MSENGSENKFITLLSDIDEKFITDMAAERAKEKSGKRALQKAAKKNVSQKPAKEKEPSYQSAKIVTIRGKKKTVSYAKIFSYAAAALAITVAAILGSRFINEKPPVDPLDTQDTEITVQNPANSTLPDLDPNETMITYTAVKDIDEKKFWDMWEENDLSSYPVLDFSYLPNIDDAYETIHAGYGSGEERIITKGILDTKKCGGFDLSLIGYGLFTDGKIYPDKMIALFGFRLVLHKNGEVVSSLVLDESIDFLFKGDHSTEFLYMLEKEYIGEFTSITDFGDHQIILARLIENDSVVARTQFFGVKNNALYLCSRGNFYQAEYISGAYTGSDIQYDVGEPHNCVITDTMLDREYYFDFSQLDIVEYDAVTQNDSFDTDMEKYSFIKDVNIPDIDLRKFEGSFEEKTKAVMAGGLPKVMFNVIRERDYTLCLVGEYLSRTENSSSDDTDYLNTELSCCNLRIMIYQYDKYIGCIIPDESLYFASMTENEYNELLPALFVTADDIALLVKRGLSDSYYGTDQFYAVKDGTIYREFNGYWNDAADNPPPQWTETAVKHDYIEWDEDTESVICGFYRYVFDFSELETGGIGIYNVYWLEEEPK